MQTHPQVHRVSSSPPGVVLSPRPVVYGMPDALLAEGASVWGVAPPLRTVPAQTPLYRQNVASSEAFLVISGRLELLRDNSVRRLRLEVVERGTWLGVPELMQRTPYACSAIALETAQVLPVPRAQFEPLIRQCPALAMRALVGCGRQALSLLDALEAQALDQTFLGLCRGLELVMGNASSMPESQLVARLRELFSLPSPSIQEVLKLLSGLNLLTRKEEPSKEAIIGLPEARSFSERVRSFADQWRGKLPTLLGAELPPEPLRLEDVCQKLNVKPPQLLRRMTLPDFPTGLLRFDAEGFEALRKVQGENFFRKKLSGRELLARLETAEELIDVEHDLLKDILPRMELPRLIRLMAGLDVALRTHLLQALSGRLRRTVGEELEHVGRAGSLEQADLEQELLALCRSV